MPPILNAQSVSKTFGATALFRNISLTVDDGARIGLIGPNGAGKSTLLAVLAGTVEPDTGEVAVRRLARTAYVAQDSRFADGLTVRAVLEAALAAVHVSETEREGRLRELAGRAGFASLDAEASSLSGGWRKRLAILEALASEPDVLLLDEPTNHMDMESIESLQIALDKYDGTLIFVSHDREFVSGLAHRIIEVKTDGSLNDFGGNYEDFLSSQGLQ